MITLRPYQQDAVDRIRAEFGAGRRRVVLVMPTGAGKTVVFCYVAQGASAKGKRILILAHRQELIEQISATLSQFDVDHGLILSGRPMDRLSVQVGMMQTVANRLTKICAPDLIVVDEAHRAVGATYQMILRAFPAAKALLVTATPARTDGRGLGEVADSMVIGPSTRELIQIGHLAPYRLFAPPVVADLSGLRKVGGDYTEASMAAAMDTPTITGDAIAHYQRYGAPGQFLAFCCGVEHASRVAEQFRGAGISCSSIDGTMERDDRNEIVKGLRSGELQGLTSCNLISEGFDVPSLSVAILLRPTASVIVYLQQVGRALRYEDGKTAIILDHVGNSKEKIHGLPDDDREWSLDGRKQGSRRSEVTVAVVQCKKCFAYYDPRLDECPVCGNERETVTREIDIADGELVEVTPDDEFRKRISALSYSAALKECENIDEIKMMARERKYKSGWSIRIVMDKYHVDKFEAARMLGYKRGAADRVSA